MSSQQVAQETAIENQDIGALRDVLRRNPSTTQQYVTMLGRLSRNLPEPIKKQIHQEIFQDIQIRDSDDNILFTLFKTIAKQEADPNSIHRLGGGQELEVTRLLITRYKKKFTPAPDGDFDFKGGTSLHFAVQLPSASIFAALLDCITDLPETEQEDVISHPDRTKNTVLQLAISTWNLDVVKLLVKRYPYILTKMVPLKLPNQRPADATNANALHVAINAAYEGLKERKTGLTIPHLEASKAQIMIDFLLEKRQELLWKDECEFGPPYAFGNRFPMMIDTRFKGILQDLKRTIMSSLESIDHIRQAMHKTGEINSELGLNLSDFNRSSHDFGKFIGDLSRYEGALGNLSFDDTILYLILPDFHECKTDDHHTHIKILFTWLETKKVKSIVRLVLPDSQTHPLSEDLFKQAILDKFTISSLSWRKMDINLDALYPPNEQIQSLNAIDLYSSGNWGSLHHWVGEEGLKRHRELGKVNILIVGQPQSPQDVKGRQGILHGTTVFDLQLTRLETYVQRVKKMLDGSDGSKALSCEPSVSVGVLPVARMESVIEDTALEASNLILPEYKECYKRIERLKNDGTSGAMRIQSTHVKIAIIDNGADRSMTSNRTSVKGGRSFVVSAEGVELPWWCMADPHGQHMASIINEINPDCDLYIARVGKGRRDVDLEAAAKAVKWAIALGVDIISISWTSRVLSKNLQKAIEEALGLHILVICSTADEGRSPGEIYPARIDPNVITVSACDHNGDRRGASQAEVDVLVIGQDVPVTGPKYIRNLARVSEPPGPSVSQPGFSVVSGSSVATAVTVGITSFLLELYRYANSDPDLWYRFKNRSKILERFSEMRKGKEEFVSPEHLLVDGLVGKTEIERHFRIAEGQ